MEIIHLNNNGKIIFFCKFITSKTIMELAGSGNEACNISIKQINHETYNEFE
jgi:hypothetical protein